MSQWQFANNLNTLPSLHLSTPAVTDLWQHWRVLISSSSSPTPPSFPTTTLLHSDYHVHLRGGQSPAKPQRDSKPRLLWNLVLSPQTSFFFHGRRDYIRSGCDAAGRNVPIQREEVSQLQSWRCARAIVPCKDRRGSGAKVWWAEGIRCKSNTRQAIGGRARRRNGYSLIGNRNCDGAQRRRKRKRKASCLECDEPYEKARLSILYSRLPARSPG